MIFCLSARRNKSLLSAIKRTTFIKRRNRASKKEFSPVEILPACRISSMALCQPFLTLLSWEHTNGHTRSNWHWFLSLLHYSLYKSLSLFHRIQSNGKVNGKKPMENDPSVKFIPDSICFLIELSLLSLVGAEKFPKDFCGDNISTKIRQKFNNALGQTRKVWTKLYTQFIYKKYKIYFFLRLYKRKRMPSFLRSQFLLLKKYPTNQNQQQKFQEHNEKSWPRKQRHPQKMLRRRVNQGEIRQRENLKWNFKVNLIHKVALVVKDCGLIPDPKNPYHNWTLLLMRLPKKWKGSSGSTLISNPHMMNLSMSIVV